MRTTGEYDAFGPWIDEVHTSDDLPRLYRDSGLDPATQRLVLKVPRNIARRDATPDMHLYDHLLAVGDETLTVLSRTGDTYDTTRVPFDRITAIEDGTALLDGRLTLHTVDGASVSIHYNGSTGTPVRDLVRLLRQLYLPPAPEPPLPTSEPAPPSGAVQASGHLPTTHEEEGADGGRAPAGSTYDQLARSLGLRLREKDIALVSAYRDLIGREPQVHLVGSCASRTVTPVTGRLGRVLNSIWPVTLHASITVADAREILILHRRRWFTRGERSVYSTAQTALPRARITAVDVVPHPRFERVHLVTVQAGGARLRFPAPTGPDTDAALAAVCR